MDRIARKSCIFGTALILMSISVVLSTRANLGVSPIAAIPYVSTLFTDMSLGNMTFIFNILLFALGIIVMGRDYKLIYLLSVVFLFVFSFLCDVFDSIIPLYDGSNYVICWLYEVGAVLFLAVGLSLSISSSLTMLPGDFLTRFISVKFRFNFGYTKLVMDAIFIVVAVVMGLVFMNEINGVREGTIFFIIATGPLVNIIMKYLDRTKLKEWVGFREIEISVNKR